MTRNRIFATFCALLVLCLHEARAQSTRTIVIDAGHGGFDRGGVPYQRIGEKNLTLDVAQRLKRVMQANGYRVIMTRDSDVFIPLGTRVAIANSHRDAIFVSIHFNSAPRWGANGIETYYYRSDASSLAASIHRNVVAMTSSENRGIRRRGFFVLRRSAIPAVLVECGFLTNPTEGNNAQNGAYRQRLAETIARGIRREPAPFNRPLARGAAASSEVLPQPFNGPDFVKAAPRARHSAHSKSHKKKHGSSKKKKSSGKKKKSSDD
ncbi:MAG: N-acetylmuramoyl-L-alanine amidase [Verrucomicrobiota bacterium]|nr:N-acetylmuramoyl-L-alanine amidase [Verrucomicrobiota bacterium]MDQ6938762.1 N-acetylmuramoyl-L-alanine amidase [Verrucomicrobiota bacterium]